MAVALDLGVDAALSDYTDLVAKVKLWLDRDDLDLFIPAFIRLAENQMNRQLRTPDMEVVAPLQSVSGMATLPQDMIGIRSLSAAGRPLTAMSPGEMAASYGQRTGVTTSYAVTGRQVTIAPTSDDALTLVYWQRIPALTLQQPSNWLFAAHPDAYLYGTLAAAYGYIGESDNEAKWGALFQGALDGIADVGNKQRYGGPIVARSGVSAVRNVRA